MNPLSKESFLEYVSARGCEGQSRIAIPRATLVGWMVEEYSRSSTGLTSVRRWNVTFAALRYACEELSKHIEGRDVQISYRETAYIQLSNEERESLRAGVPLGTEEDAFVLFAVGGLKESALRDPGMWLGFKAEFRVFADELRQMGSADAEIVLGAYGMKEALLWDFTGVAGPDLREECAEICTRAGLASGASVTQNPLFFWFDSLREYLAAIGSDRLYPPGAEHGIIQSIAEGSVSYCSWLSREAALCKHQNVASKRGTEGFGSESEDTSRPGVVLSGSLKSIRRKPGPKPNVEQARKIVIAINEVTESTYDWKDAKHLQLICELLDEREIAFPKRWRRDAESWSDMLHVGRERVVKAVERAQRLGANSV